MVESIFFYIFAGIAVISAIGVVLQPKPTRALLSLIVTMFSLAVLFLLLRAPFIAAVHLIVYAGAVLVLFLFVIMLQGIGAMDKPLRQRFSKGQILVTFMTVLGFFFLIQSVFFKYPIPMFDSQVVGKVDDVGMLLFSKYLLPFELASFILLLGVFAAVALAKKDKEPV